jgi:hypothetical protein
MKKRGVKKMILHKTQKETEAVTEFLEHILENFDAFIEKIRK